MVAYVVPACIIIVLCMGSGLFILHLLAIFYAGRRLNRPVLMPKSTLENIGVTIVKPLNGIDSSSYLNLETYFQLDYPRFEILFCVETEDDPILMVLASLVRKYPKVDQQILIGSDRIGSNPKVNNMYKGFQASKYSIIMIGDAGISVRPETLSDMVSVLMMEENVGLVHQIPWIVQRPGFANLLQMVFFGTWHAKMYLGLNILNVNCTTGMSTLMRKDVFEEAGGLQLISKYLAEDFYMAEMFRRRGSKVRLARLPALQNPGYNTVESFERRQVRWWKLRLSLSPIPALLEPLSGAIPCTIIASVLVSILIPAINPIVWGLCMGLVWFLLDFTLLRLMIGPDDPVVSPFIYLCVWVYRELCNPIIFARAVYRWHHVEWHHRKFRLRFGGVTEEITEVV